MSMPLPPSKGELSENEAGFILDATLKPKHRSDVTVVKFIESFVRCKNIAQASDEAGVHYSLGYSMRHRRDVSNAIQKIIDKSAAKYGFDASEVLERVKEVSDVDPIEFVHPDGSFKELHDIKPEARRAIKKFKAKNIYEQVEDMNGMKSKIVVGRLFDVEFHDKLKASELVGKEKEMFKNTTKVVHDVTENMGSILLESAQRGEDAKRKVIDVRTDYKEIK